MIVNDGGAGTRYSTGMSIGSAAKKIAKAVPRISAARRRYSSSSGRASYGRPVRSRSGGYGSGNGSGNRSHYNGGGGSSSSSSSKPSFAVKKKVAPPSLGTYLGSDSAYQQAVRGGKRTLNDFLSELGRRKGEASTQFKQTKSSMERDRTTQLEDLKNEFASRGLIQSGLYGEEQGKFQQKYGEQQTALQQQQTGLLADLMNQEKNYRREHDLALESAKQEAILRRASKYKIGA